MPFDFAPLQWLSPIQLDSFAISAAVSQRVDVTSGYAVRVAPDNQGVHVNMGGSTVVATLTDEFVAAGSVQTFYRVPPSTVTHVAVLETALGAAGTITILG